MKFQQAILTLLVLLAPSCALTYEETVAYPPNDLEGWGREFSDGRWAGHVMEFVPPGQNVKDWIEMFTIQFFRDNSDPLESALASMEERIRTVCPDLEFRKVSEDSISVTYEFWTRGTASIEAQHEVGRFLTGKTGLHRVAYARKGPKMPNAIRAKWLHNIQYSILFDAENGKSVYPAEEDTIKELRIPVIRKPRIPFF